jgi:4-alpha-glucanotransferase
LFEELVLASFEFLDARDDMVSMASHRICMTTSGAMIRLGSGGLGDERPQFQIARLVGEMSELFVDDPEFLAQRTQTRRRLSEAAFDETFAHGGRSYDDHSARLHDMIDAWGIADGYHDIEGAWHPIDEDVRTALRERIGDPADAPEPQWFVESGAVHDLLGPCELVLEDGTAVGAVTSLPPDLPVGYHELVPLDGGPTTWLVVHPSKCPSPGRRWGVAAQTASLWSDDTWGIGDLDDVAALARRIEAAGGGALLVSPLHAPRPSAVQESSPYSPSSRRWWNPLLLRPARQRPAALRVTSASLIDRDAVWRAKRPAFVEELAADSSDWRAWAASRGPDLDRYARWCALAERLGPGESFPVAPGDHAHLERQVNDDADLTAAYELHRYLQWRLHEALRVAGSAGCGIVTDLAVGSAADGYDAWDLTGSVSTEVGLGAPPDPFNDAGQNWGLAPFLPNGLRRDRFRAFISVIRATLHGASGLRIDHVMGLHRQYWIPAGAAPDEGGYVHFPFRQLLAILAIESTRVGAYVVGEDLGTVPPAVRDGMSEFGVLGTVVGLFEHAAPALWRRDALATITTHDLPTSTGVLAGPDSPERRQLEHLAAGGAGTGDPIDRAHATLLTSPPTIRLVTAEDLCRSEVRPNTPGTIGPHNWCSRLPLAVGDLPLPVTAIFETE